jgi:hypothetical protein
VFPDIIVHRRQQKENLLVIEAKKSGNANDLDRKKLHAFMSDNHYEYAFAVLLSFDTSESYDVRFERWP